MLGVVAQEPGCTCEVLPTDGQLDLRRLLDVFDPVAVHVRCPDVNLIAVITNQIVTS